MKTQFRRTFRIGMALFLSLFATNLLPVTAAYARESAPEPVTTTQTWSNNGSENAALSCQPGQTAYWHWILTPGGNNTLTSATLNVTFQSGATASDDGETRSGGANGALHFDITRPVSDTVTAASVTYTYIGNGGNFVLTISNSECQGTPASQLAPTATAVAIACTPESGMNDKVSVSVTNTDDATNTTVEYTIVLGGQTKKLTLVDGATGNVEFGGLAVGAYSATVTGTDGTVTTNTVEVKACPAPERVRGDYNLTSLCKPSPTQGQFRIRNQSDAAEAYTLVKVGSAETYSGTAAANTDVTVTVPYGSSSDTYKLTIAGFEYVKAIGNNPLCETPSPLAPTATATIVACTPESGLTTKVNVVVTNTNDETDGTVTYTIVLAGQTKTLTLADGATGNVEFGGVAAGSYTATVTGTDGMVVTNSVTVVECGGRGGDDEQLLPMVFLLSPVCVPVGGSGAIKLAATNPNTVDVDYEWDLVHVESGTVLYSDETLTIAAGDTVNATFENVSAGTYRLVIDDGVNALRQATITITNCETGVVLGTATRTTTTTTPGLGAAIPAELPATGPGNQIGLLIAFLASALTYTVVLRRQKLQQLSASMK